MMQHEQAADLEQQAGGRPQCTAGAFHPPGEAAGPGATGGPRAR